MPDDTGLYNMIQGRVLQIRERRPLDEQLSQLDHLLKFLNDQMFNVQEARVEVLRELRRRRDDQATSSDSQPEPPE